MAVTLESFPFDSEEGESDDDLESVSASESENGEMTTSVSKTEARSESASKNRVYYRCDKCSYQTEMRRLLDLHMAKHRPFQCSSCDYTNYDHEVFVDHWVTHQLTQAIRCTFCSFECNVPESLKLHIPKHRPVEMLDCSMCEFSAGDVNSMKRHIEASHTKTYPSKPSKEHMTEHDVMKHYAHEGDPEKKFADTLNKFRAAKSSKEANNTDDSVEIKPAVVKVVKSGCGHHNCNCTPEEPDELTLFESPRSPEDDPDLTPKLENHELNCSLCKFTATNQLSLKYHTVVFHRKKVSCAHCPAVMTKHDMIQHALKEHGIDIHSRPVLKDDVTSTYSEGSECCSGAYEPVSSAVQDSAGSAKELKCSFCKYSTRRTDCLDSHVSRLHTKKYPCELCSAVLTKHELIEHCWNIHHMVISLNANLSSSLLYSSEVKGETSSNESGPVGECRTSLPSGRRSSDRNQPVLEKYNCPFCPFSSSSKFRLKGHKESFHKKIYTCKHCDVVMTKCSLMVHSREEHGVGVKLNGSASRRYYLRQQSRGIKKHANRRKSTQSSRKGLRGKQKKVHPKGSVQSYSLRSENARMVQNPKFQKSHKISPKNTSLPLKTFPPETSPSGSGIASDSKNRIGNTSCYESKDSRGEALDGEILRCKSCEYQTARKDLLLRHEAKHEPLECPMCGMEFSKGFTFSVHLSKHNSPQSPYKCFYCGHISKCHSNLYVHLAKHIKAIKKHDCPECEFSCVRPDILRQHLASHGKIDGAKKNGVLISDTSISDQSEISKESADLSSKPSVISSCVLKRASAASLTCNSSDVNLFGSIKSKKAKYMEGSERIVKLPEKKAADGDSQYLEKSSLGLLRCNNCSYETEIESLMRRHVKLHLPEGSFECPKCDFKENSTSSFANHLRSHDPSGAARRCCFCGVSIKNSLVFLQHLNLHRPVDSYFCSKCTYSSARRCSLFRHTARYHAKKYVCAMCPKVADRFTLGQHFKKCHPSSSFKCSIAPQLLQKKVISHGVAPNPKSRVSTEIVSPSASMIRLVDGDVANELFQCKICEYKTAREDLLRRHEAKHVPLECPVCNMEFSKGYAFMSHLSRHNLPGPRYKCFYCTFVGKSLPELYVHVSSHVDALQKRDCSECEFTCLLPSSLERHLATHSKKNDDSNQNLAELSAKISSEHSAVSSWKPGTDLNRPAFEVNVKSSTISSCEPGLEATVGGPSNSDISTRTQSLAHPETVILDSTRKSEPLNKITSPKLAERINADVSLSGSSSGLARACFIPKPKLHCHSCPYVTKIKSLMRRHVIRHLPEGQYACPKCDFRTDKNRNFAKHLASHEPPRARVKCCFCNFSASVVQYMAYHVQTHQPVREYCCSKCEFSCVRLSLLDTHYTNNHVNRHVCPKCPKVATKFKLSLHLEKCHPCFESKPSGRQATSQSELTHKLVARGSNVPSNLKSRIAAKKDFRRRINHGDGSTMERERLRCKTSESQTARKDKSLLNKAEPVVLPSAIHGNSHKNTPDSSSKRAVKFSVYSDVDSLPEWDQREVEHVSSQELNQHQCPSCDFRTMRDDLFKRHHEKHKPLVCPVCSSSTTSHLQFAAHFMEHNPARTPFKCHYCGHVSKSKQHLAYHLALHIDAMKIFDCPFCEYCSIRADLLLGHFKVHRMLESPNTPKPSPKRSDDNPVALKSRTGPEVIHTKTLNVPKQSLFHSGKNIPAGISHSKGMCMDLTPSPVFMNLLENSESRVDDPARNVSEMETDAEIGSDLGVNAEVKLPFSDTASSEAPADSVGVIPSITAMTPNDRTPEKSIPMTDVLPNIVTTATICSDTQISAVAPSNTMGQGSRKIDTSSNDTTAVQDFKMAASSRMVNPKAPSESASTYTVFKRHESSEI